LRGQRGLAVPEQQESSPSGRERTATEPTDRTGRAETPASPATPSPPRARLQAGFRGPHQKCGGSSPHRTTVSAGAARTSFSSVMFSSSRQPSQRFWLEPGGAHPALLRAQLVVQLEQVVGQPAASVSRSFAAAKPSASRAASAADLRSPASAAFASRDFDPAGELGGARRRVLAPLHHLQHTTSSRSDCRLASEAIFALEVLAVLGSR